MIKEWYKIIRKSPNMILDNDEILSFYPDYYRVKEEIENESIDMPSIGSAIKYFNDNYKESNTYQELLMKSGNEVEIYDQMVVRIIERYNRLYNVITLAKSKCIDLCDLVDYIGHYPERYPAPNEEERNDKLEELMNEYDIFVGFHMTDDGKYRLGLSSYDMVRIIEALKEKIKIFSLQNVYFKSYRWIFDNELSEEEMDEKYTLLEGILNDFPKSLEQLIGTTKKEELKKKLIKQNN